MIFLKNEKKDHFKGKMKLTKMKIWDLEFMIGQLRTLREGWRQEYDRLQEQVDAATARLADEKAKADGDKTIIDNLTKLLERYAPDIEQLKKNMEGIDRQIDGYEDTEGHHEGMRDTVEAHRSNLGLIREFVRSL